MDIAAFVIAVVALALATVSFLAQREVFLHLGQVRSALHLDDEARSAEVARVRGRTPKEFGLPAEVGGPGDSFLLVLSATCATCHSIAAMLARGIPDRLWVLVEDRIAENEGDLAPELVRLYELRSPQVIGDSDGSIAAGMGISTSPLLLRLRDATFVEGFVLGSSRQLWSILPDEMSIS